MQCLTCLQYSKPDKAGMAQCRKTGEIQAALPARKCANWKLAPMAIVRGRSVRKVLFDNSGLARLA